MAIGGKLRENFAHVLVPSFPLGYAFFAYINRGMATACSRSVSNATCLSYDLPTRSWIAAGGYGHRKKDCPAILPMNDTHLWVAGGSLEEVEEEYINTSRLIASDK